MKLSFIIILLLNVSNVIAQTDSSNVNSNNSELILGTWIIDLKPSPDSDPYLKDFTIKSVDGNNFSGIFYDTQFEDGILNLNWKKIYFSFSTKDKNNSYFHSGYIDGDNILGVTFSPERQFTMPWRGKKSKM